MALSCRAAQESTGKLAAGGCSNADPSIQSISWLPHAPSAGLVSRACQQALQRVPEQAGSL